MHVLKLATLCCAFVALPALAQSSVTIEDLQQCKTAIVAFQNAALRFFQPETQKYNCNDSFYDCSGLRRIAGEIAAEDPISFFWKGNDSCGGLGYPCFGKESLGLITGDPARVKETLATDAPPVFSYINGEPAIDSGQADKCIIQAWQKRIVKSQAPTAKLLRKFGNGCVKLADANVERIEAGTTSDWVITTFSLINNCAKDQHFEFMVGDEGFGLPKRPTTFNNQLGITPAWPEGSIPYPKLPFVPLAQVAASVGIGANKTVTTEYRKLTLKFEQPSDIVYIIASCDTLSSKGRMAVFRDDRLENGWICVPIPVK